MTLSIKLTDRQYMRLQKIRKAYAERGLHYTLTERERIHQDALDEQDRLFKYYAHLRQKIYAGLFVVAILIAWGWLIKYNPVHVWYGFIVVPFALFGLWLMITSTNYPWELTHENE